MLRIVEADTFAILLLDDERRFLTVRAANGSTRKIDGAVPIPFRGGHGGQRRGFGKPVVIDDLAKVELAKPASAPARDRPPGAVPIADRRIAVDRRRSRRLDPAGAFRRRRRADYSA